MKLFDTLRFRLTALLFLQGALLIGLSHYRDLHRNVRREEESIRTQAYAMGTRMSGIAEHAYHRNQVTTADLDMSYASAVPELGVGFICDGKNMVRNATELQWRGMPLDKTPFTHAIPQISRARARLTAEVVEDTQRQRLVAVFPFEESKVTFLTGVVVLEFDLNLPRASARRAAFNDTVSQALALLAACLLVWLAMQLMVTSRLGFVVSQTDAAAGTGDVMAPLSGKDEVAQLSRSFARAFQKLKDSERQFRQFAASMRDVLWIAPAAGMGAPFANLAFQSGWALDRAILQRKRWSWLRRVRREDRGRVLRFLAGLRHRGDGGELEFRLILPKGETRWIQCRGFQLAPVSSGHEASVGGVAVDITERREIARRLVEVAEDERRRIGVDLHDDVCQRLAAAQMKCGVLEMLLTQEKNPHAALADAMVKEIGAAAGIAKNFAQGIAPVALSVGAIGPTLEQLARRVEKGFDISCSASCTVEGPILGEETAAHVFRIAQELAVNAAKHGHGGWISIRFSLPPGSPGMARLEVANDGITFDSSAIHGEGMGLHLVKQRADVIGASLTYYPRTDEGGGTVVICDIPIAADSGNPASKT